MKARNWRCHDKLYSINAPHRRVLIFDPPTRRRRCNLSTFSVTPCTADYGTAVRAVAGRGLGTGYCDNSLTYTPPRNRTRCARRVLLRRPVVEPLQLCQKLLPASRSDTDLCSNCLVLWSARYVLHCEQEIHYHRLLSHLVVHSHYSPGGIRFHALRLQRTGRSDALSLH